MTPAWFALLAGAVGLGVAVVAAMVLPRPVATLALAAGLATLAATVAALGAISRYYQTPQAIGLAILSIAAGAAGGYGLAAAALPLLGHRTAVSVRAAAGPGPLSGLPTVVLVSYSEPETYSARSVATHGNDLADGGALELPSTAFPLVFLAERARYAAVGGRSPAAPAARALASGVRALLAHDGRATHVEVAWCYGRPTLAEAVAQSAASGSREVAIVVLGFEDSSPIDRQKQALDQAGLREAGVKVLFGPSVWTDRRLPARLAERIVSATQGTDLASVGVVLVGAGVPPAWETEHPQAGSEENYFNQRVRLLLAEAGIDERRVRVAWLDFQVPDVTEAVRHLAALGCSRIVVTPSTIALPSLATVLDLRRAVELARVPGEVQTVVLGAWGDDPVLVQAVAASAERALEAAGVQIASRAQD